MTSSKNSRYTLTNGRLAIQNPNERLDAGDYRCEAANKFGTVVSNTVSISFGCEFCCCGGGGGRRRRRRFVFLFYSAIFLLLCFTFRSWDSSAVERRTRDQVTTTAMFVLLLLLLWSQVRVPTGAAGEFPSTGSTFLYADSYFGIRSTTVLPR